MDDAAFHPAGDGHDLAGHVARELVRSQHDDLACDVAGLRDLPQRHRPGEAPHVLGIEAPARHRGLGPAGEDRVHARPGSDAHAAAWAAYLYERRNLDGPQEEWWFHRLGCRRWFLARRDTRDNHVLATWLPEEPAPAADWPAP